MKTRFLKRDCIMNKAEELITFMTDEIKNHINMLTSIKKIIYNLFVSKYRLIIIFIFTLLFVPHVFVVVRDINFVLAYEVDPGSIIQSIMSLYQNSYNMNSAYHSSYYG